MLITLLLPDQTGGRAHGRREAHHKRVQSAQHDLISCLSFDKSSSTRHTATHQHDTTRIYTIYDINVFYNQTQSQTNTDYTIHVKPYYVQHRIHIKKLQQLLLSYKPYRIYIHLGVSVSDCQLNEPNFRSNIC